MLLKQRHVCYLPCWCGIHRCTTMAMHGSMPMCCPLKSYHVSRNLPVLHECCLQGVKRPAAFSVPVDAFCRSRGTPVSLHMRPRLSTCSASVYRSGA